MVDPQIGALDKLNAVQPAGDIENPLNHILQLEIGRNCSSSRLYSACLTFRRKTPIPGLQGERVSLSLDHACIFFASARGAVERRFPQPIEQFIDVGRILGHVALELKVGVGGVAEQIGAFDAQGSDSADDFLVVQLIVVVPAHAIGFEHLFAQIAFFRILQKRDQARMVQSENPFALQAAFGRFFGGGFFHHRRQAGEIGFIVDHQTEGVVLFQDVLAELQRQQRQFLVDLRSLAFALRSDWRRRGRKSR